MRKILVLNGPNLGMLGRRQPEVYGHGTLAELVDDLVAFGGRLGVEIEHAQSDDESELIGRILGTDADGIVLNAGALTHTSRALADALRSVDVPAVEVHISDIRAREPWRAMSVIEDACVATIAGRGRLGYRDAVRHLVNRWSAPFETVRYGPHPTNVGEVRPGQGLVVLVHGGVWRRSYGRDSLESVAVDLHRRGVRTWNVGYRRLGEGGGWPGSAHDVLTALDHASRIADGPVVVLGHSAGGYLAMWAATRTATPVSLVVALSPIADLEMAVADTGEIAAESAILLEHGAPARPSPLHPHTLAAHGTADRLVPIGHSDALEAAGAEVIRLDCGHFEPIDPAKQPWQEVAGRVVPAVLEG
ncbi:MAG: type II 3-dehydroquinate dehydratase [Actinomycetes bacterium]|jgi:3-dehydroquinate dehydratase-2|nr:MAG: hypothetical protein DIU67_05790 [Actinomycetota bacterium]